jgi:hypothetical protein
MFFFYTYVGVFRVNTSFGVVLSINFTLDLGFEELDFLRFSEEDFCWNWKGEGGADETVEGRIEAF